MKTRLFLIVLLISTITDAWAQRGLQVEEQRADEVQFFKYPVRQKKDRYKVAVLTPMYLDSVNWESNLTKLPKFMMPGLDFYQGVMIAADTLRNLGYKLDVYVYDSKSNVFDVRSLIESDKLDSMDLIIGNASVNDLKLVADFAKKNLINFVSAVSPSDAGQEFNPYFTILQPRLVSHIERIHKHIHMHNTEDNVFFLHRNLSAEKNALNYFKNDILYAMPRRFTEIELKSDSVSLKQLSAKIDSNYATTIVLGVLDASVSYTILKQLAPLAKSHKLQVYCMPTAEAIKALSKTDEFPGMTIFHTTSYLVDRITPTSTYISKAYKEKMGGIPSDVVYKGFESLYFFATLMKRYGVPFNEKIGDNAYSLITPYKIVPVKENGKLRFYENKYLYIVRHENGIMTYE